MRVVERSLIPDFKCEQSSICRERIRHRRARSGRTPSWMSRSTTSETSASYLEGAERLAAAASRVDRMLEELTAVANMDGKLECRPFPTALSASTRSLRLDIPI